jgi:hypothetical protein
MEPWELSAREAVRHTIGAYTYFADHGRFDEVAALFAPDGVLEVRGIGGARAEGRDAVRAFFGGVGDDVKTTKPPGRMQHHVSSVVITDVSTESANAASYFTVFTGDGVDHWGRYRDRLVPVGDAWLFASRTVDTDGYRPGGWADTRR